MTNVWVVCRGVAAAATFSALGVLAGPAVADEAWQTDWGTVVYAEDIGALAVLSYDDGAFFVDGLGGNTTNRGYFSGYWVDYADGDLVCDVPAYDPYGNELWTWGLIEVSFTDAGYPARWQASYTLCDGPVEGTISAYPM